MLNMSFFIATEAILEQLMLYVSTGRTMRTILYYGTNGLCTVKIVQFLAPTGDDFRKELLQKTVFFYLDHSCRNTENIQLEEA